jgi:hypothetical protein
LWSKSAPPRSTGAGMKMKPKASTSKCSHSWPPPVQHRMLPLYPAFEYLKGQTNMRSMRLPVTQSCS